MRSQKARKSRKKWSVIVKKKRNQSLERLLLLLLLLLKSLSPSPPGLSDRLDRLSEVAEGLGQSEDLLLDFAEVDVQSDRLSDFSVELAQPILLSNFVDKAEKRFDLLSVSAMRALKSF